MVSAASGRARSVTEHLGLTQEEVAEMVDATPRTVHRWWTGASAPQPQKLKRLRELAYVIEELAKVLQPEPAREWLFTPNRQLDHDSPAERVARGEYRSVLALVDALAEGVVA